MAAAAAGAAAAAAPPNDGDDDGPLASMPLDVLQKIFSQVPLESRLKPAFAAKFLWLAASSPSAAGASSAASSPLGPLLPPAALGPPGAFEPTPTARRSGDDSPLFPPKAASKKRNRWSLAGHEFAAATTPKGNPKSMKGLALVGGGTGVLRGKTKWLGTNFIRGVHITDQVEISAKGRLTLIGCRIDAPIKLLGGASLTMIGCTRRLSEREIGVKVGVAAKLVMIDCNLIRVGEELTSGSPIYSRGYESVEIRNCTFDGVGMLDLTGRQEGSSSDDAQDRAQERRDRAPSTFALEGCTFKPVPLSEMGSHYDVPDNPEEDIFMRGGLNMWYSGPVAKDFCVRDNDFSGRVLFWDHWEGTMRLENNKFHGADVGADVPVRKRPQTHVEMDGMTPSEHYPVSTAVVEVVGAPPWLRHEGKNGASVECVDA